MRKGPLSRAQKQVQAFIGQGGTEERGQMNEIMPLLSPSAAPTVTGVLTLCWRLALRTQVTLQTWLYSVSHDILLPVPLSRGPQVSGDPASSLGPLWKAHLLLFSPSVGQVVNIKAKVNRAFNSSMEVCVGRALPGGEWVLGGFSISSPFSVPSPGAPTLAEPWLRQPSSEPAGRAGRILRISLFNTP